MPPSRGAGASRRWSDEQPDLTLDEVAIPRPAAGNVVPRIAQTNSRRRSPSWRVCVGTAPCERRRPSCSFYLVTWLLQTLHTTRYDARCFCLIST